MDPIIDNLRFKCLFDRLTSFVIKSFAQAYDIITIDDDGVMKAVQWIVEQQDRDGSFNEPGRVLHKAMQVSSESSDKSCDIVSLVVNYWTEGSGRFLQWARLGLSWWHAG